MRVKQNREIPESSETATGMTPIFSAYKRYLIRLVFVSPTSNPELNGNHLRVADTLSLCKNDIGRKSGVNRV